MIADVIYYINGAKLWDNDREDNDEWWSILTSLDFNKYMKLYRFK